MASENKVKTKGKAPPHAWKPGQSGNPGGRPKAIVEVVELARAHSERAVTRLAELMESENEPVARAASDSLLDRAWGKPAQSVAIDAKVTDQRSLTIARAIVDQHPDLAELVFGAKEGKDG